MSDQDNQIAGCTRLTSCTAMMHWSGCLTNPAHPLKALECLREILPLAEAYLQSAPGHPDNAKLEDARAVIAAADRLSKNS